MNEQIRRRRNDKRELVVHVQHPDPDFRKVRVEKMVLRGATHRFWFLAPAQLEVPGARAAGDEPEEQCYLRGRGTLVDPKTGHGSHAKPRVKITIGALLKLLELVRAHCPACGWRSNRGRRGDLFLDMTDCPICRTELELREVKARVWTKKREAKRGPPTPLEARRARGDHA